MRSIVAAPSSVFVTAPPMPGKCFAVGATRPLRQPRTDSAIASAAAWKSVENARPASAAPGTLATSPTGASETLTPLARSARAAASASSPTLPAAACAGCEPAGGAHGRMRMSPPSWSTMTSGVPPSRLPQAAGQRLRLVGRR